jgi:hypothetical protein
MKLSCQLTASDNPDIPAAGSLDHLPVHRPNVAAHEPDVHVRQRRERARGEDPGRLAVRPRLRLLRRGAYDIPQHPLVGGRPHRERTNVLDECRVTRTLDVAERKEPLERIIKGGDETVETGSGVVLRLHAASLSR